MTIHRQPKYTQTEAQTQILEHRNDAVTTYQSHRVSPISQQDEYSHVFKAFLLNLYVNYFRSMAVKHICGHGQHRLCHLKQLIFQYNSCTFLCNN